MINIKKMSRNAIIAMTLIILLIASIGIVSVNAVQGYVASENHERKILIKYKDSGDSKDKKDQVKNQIKDKLNLSKLESKKILKQRNIELVEIGLNDDMDKTIKELKNNPNVQYAQPDYEVKASSTPQDPKFGDEWGISNTGQTVGGKAGTSGIDINALKAWDVTNGNASTLVGILDTGIDINHEDLKDSIFVNPNDLKDDGTDNDQNSYIDDVNGWNFADKNKDVFSSSASDSHGTKVAGILAAQLNDKGIVGVAPKVKLLPLKFMKGDSGYTSDAIEAIEYAKSLGVKVINCSWGSADFNQALYDEMENSGIVFICAAGNQGKDTSKSGFFPASYDLPNVISVAAMDNKGDLLSTSNYGKDVQVAAPGGDVLTTIPGNGYGSFSGTSMAAPFVSGIAALLSSQDSSITAETIALRIKNSVTTSDSLKKKVSSGGYVNAFGALKDDSVYQGKTNGKDKWSKKNPDGNLKVYTQTVSDKLLEQIHYGDKGVNPASGNFSRAFNDMTIPSVGLGMDINIARIYNSQDNAPSLMGRGWSFSYKSTIMTDSLDSTLKIVTLPNAKKSVYKDNGDETYTAQDSRNVLTISGGLYTLTTPDQFTYNFNSYGNLTTIKDKNDNTTTISVDNSNGRVLSITDNVNRTVSVAYNTQGFISSITDAAGRQVLYTYTNSLLTNVADPAGNNRKYAYDASNFLNQYKDHNDNILLELTYDHVNGDKATSYKDEFGTTYSITYDTTNKVTITTSGSVVIKKWYDNRKDIVKSQDPEEKNTIVTYFVDGNGNNLFGEEKEITDRSGNLTKYERDANGNITKQINPDNSEILYTYDNKNNLTSVTDESGKKIFYVYDTLQKNMIKKVQPLNGTDTYVSGTSNDANFSITTYLYYTESERVANGYKVKGLIKTETNQEGQVTSYTYDSNGNNLTITDPAGKVTTITYNSAGWKTQEITPNNVTTNFTYDLNGNIEKQDTAGIVVSRTVYDNLGRKTKEISANEYNPALDSIATHSYSGDVGDRYTYTAAGKVSTEKDPNGNITSYTYDAYGNVLTETKPNASIYTYAYDLMNRITSVSFKDNSGATAILLKEFTYTVLANKNDQVKTKECFSATAGDFAESYVEKDFSDRIVKETNAEGSNLISTYNSNGTLATSSDAKGSVTYYSYDGLNRLIGKWTPVSASNFSYSGFSYDKTGKITEERVGKTLVAQNVTPSADDLIKKNYYYYSNGKLQYEKDGAGKTRVAYQYDNDGYVSVKDEYTSDTAMNSTEYVNNSFGKPTQIKVHVKEGDISGYDFNSVTDKILTTTNVYDNNGNLTSTTSPNNVTSTFTYDNMNRVLSSTTPCQDETGTVVSVVTSQTYDWNGKVLTSTDGKGNVTTNTYNARNLLTKTTNAKSGVSAFYYDFSGRKIAEVSPKDYDSAKTLVQMNRTEYSYDKMNRLVSKINKYYDIATSQWIDVYVKAIKYDVNGNAIKTLDALGCDEVASSVLADKLNSGIGKTYEYNLANKVTKATDPLSKFKTFTYDGLGRKLSEVNERNITSSFTYDDSSNLTTVITAGITVDQRTYNYLGKVLSQTDGNGNVTNFTYNALGEVRTTEKVVPGSDTSMPTNLIKCQYDAAGNLKYQSDTAGTVDLFDYDNVGRPILYTQKKSDNSQSISTSKKYDKNGNVRFETDGNGTINENTYDELNRQITSKITVSGVLHTTSYTYDANGNQLTIKDWLDNISTTEYDPLNRAVKKIDAYSKTIQKIEYNKNNKVIKSYDARNSLTQFTYDRNNRLLSQIDAYGKSKIKTYDEVGNVLTEKDELNHTTTYTYNSFNKVTNVNNAKGENSSFTYDNNGNVLTKTDGKGNVTTYTYNACDKVKTNTDGTVISDPDRTERYTYLANGLLATKLDKNGKTTTFTYDCHGRMLSQTVGSSSISYTFDNNGNQLTLVDSTGTTTRTYDELGRTMTKVVSNISGTTTFTYDEKNTPNDGCYSETTTDVKNNVTRKLFDKVGRLIKVTADSKDTLYTYDDAGNQLTVTISGVSSETYTYDLNNKILSVTNKKADNTAIDSYVYTYDFAGNQVSKVETSIDTNGGLPVSTTFQFDELNRLKKVISPDNKTIDYTFDAAGNRLSETKATSGVTTETTSYTYNDQNRLLSTETITASTGNSLKKVFSYDNNGNMVYNTTEEAIVYEDSKTISIGFLKLGIETDTLSCKATLFTYDDFNHLIKAVAGTQTYTYTYNGENRQIAKTNGTNVIKYLYEGDRVILETNAAGTEIGRHVYGNSIIERKEGSTAAYYLFNGNNDVVKLVNSSGVSLNSYGYDSFGNMTNLIPPTFNNYIYSAGQTYDSGTGLYYGEAGLHDPTTDYTCRSQYFTPQEDGIYYGGSTATPYMTQQGEPYKETVPTGKGGPAPDIELPNPEFKAVEEDTKGTGNVTTTVDPIGTSEELPDEYFCQLLKYGIDNSLFGNVDYNALRSNYEQYISSRGISNGGSEIGLSSNNDDSNKRTIASHTSNSLLDYIKSIKIEDYTRTFFQVLVQNPYFVNATQHNLLSSIFWEFGFFQGSPGSFPGEIGYADVAYHARQDCLQQYGGYNGIYDGVFYYSTFMKKTNFQFKDDKGEYILWAWKGDYLNLGAGAELGIYKRLWKTDHWFVDQSLSMPMTLEVSEKNNGNKILYYAPYAKQWWVTGWNPYYQDPNVDNLTATYTIDFSGNKELYKAFIESEDYLQNTNIWSPGKNNKYIMTLVF